MAIELRILSGARAGYSESFEKSVIAVGRHPLSDLRFDAKQDLDVSTRHGEIRFANGRYTVYDQQSTNGTYVNGERVASGGSRELQDSDVIAFGSHGPTVAVRILGKPATPVSSRVTEEMPGPPAAAAVASGAAPVKKPRRNTAERVAIAVREQTRGLKIAAAGAIVVLGGLAAAIYVKGSRDAAARDVEIQKLVSANAQLSKDFETRLEGDTALIMSLRQHNDSLMRDVRQAHSAEQAATAQRALRQSQDVQRKFTEVLPAVHAKNDRAIVLITTEVNGRPKDEATGFSVSSTGLIVTNRHVVVDTAGARVSRINVKFADTRTVLHAHIVKLADDPTIDLAVLQVDEPGTYPRVSDIAPSLSEPVGSTISTLGFPLGTDLPMEGAVAKTTQTVGTVSKVLSDEFQLDAFATHGSSGSPVFDSQARVIGVVYGGREGRIVLAVSAERIQELLKGVH